MGQDSPTPKNIHLKIRRRLDVESATTLEEGGFKVYFDGCINEKTQCAFLERVSLNWDRK